MNLLKTRDLNGNFCYQYGNYTIVKDGRTWTLYKSSEVIWDGMLTLKEAKEYLHRFSNQNTC